MARTTRRVALGLRAPRLPWSLWLMCGAAAAPGCTAQESRRDADFLVISVEQQTAWVRNFNPFLPQGSARWPTHAGIHEPLMVFNGLTGRYVPWLALGAHWEDEGLALRFAMRPGVLWSDGHTCDAEDVVFTLDLMQRFPALDMGGIWRYLEAVQAQGPLQVVVRFKRVFVPALHALAQVPIVPEHIWAHVADPVTYANPHPVGTGPFTEVTVFRDQVWQLERNPHYWQSDAPGVRGLRFPAFASNDAANLALVSGAVDWASNFVPSVERVFVRRDPEHFRYWFPAINSTVFLYLNTTRPAFSSARVRKALSRAIDRRLLVRVAMYDYTEPADATGLNQTFAAWRESEAAVEAWTAYDPRAAARELDDEGFHLDADGWRRGPNDEPLRFNIEVVTGWSDWVRAAQMCAHNLRAIGIDARVKPYTFSAWMGRLQRGDFDMAVAWSFPAPTPYGYYRWLMGSGSVRPLGEPAAGNWHRFGDPEADALLAQFERTLDEPRQRALAAALTRRFTEVAPALPLFASPAWGAFNTRYFEGFPDADDSYATPSLATPPEYLPALVRIRPVGGHIARRHPAVDGQRQGAP